MTTATFDDWKTTLMEIGVDESMITEDLVATLSGNEFDPAKMTYETFQGYFSGDSETAAGEKVAAEFASLGDTDWFLEKAIDWSKAWANIKEGEGYALFATAAADKWALFNRNK